MWDIFSSGVWFQTNFCVIPLIWNRLYTNECNIHRRWNLVYAIIFYRKNVQYFAWHKILKKSASSEICTNGVPGEGCLWNVYDDIFFTKKETDTIRWLDFFNGINKLSQEWGQLSIGLECHEINEKVVITLSCEKMNLKGLSSLACQGFGGGAMFTRRRCVRIGRKKCLKWWWDGL